MGNGPDRSTYAKGHQQAAENQARFQRDPAKDTVQAGILGQQAFGDGENLGEGRERNQLKTEQYGNERVQKRMHVKANAVEHAWPRQQ